jgi:glutaconate CoA-transferase subunit B
MEHSKEELLICTISAMLADVDHVAVGVASPIPGAATMLQNELGGVSRVTVLNSRNEQAINDGVTELFDMAAQGRIGAFFLSGGQIDGQANINLLGVGDYPQMKVRWSGSFGSAMLYYLVPKVILFREEHTKRTLVEAVDFVSAPGPRDDGVYRTGGPHALVTELCVFDYIRKTRGFRLASLHPGVSLDEVKDNTGFDFEVSDNLGQTMLPTDHQLGLLRGKVGRRVADPYPNFAKQVWNLEGIG